MFNETAKAVAEAGSMAAYDARAKNVLADKNILARILQRVVKEVQGMSIPEIISCIEGEPEISTIPVDPGMAAARITGMPNESNIIGESVIFFDIRFNVLLPKGLGKIKLIINVEAQKKYNPGYHIVTRGIFYNARQMSMQLGNEFKVPHYDDLKAVYSIWICMDTSQKVGNAISEYRITKQDIIPGIKDTPENYDKSTVIVITLNEKMKSEDSFINMMNTLFSSSMNGDEKVQELEETYGLPMKEKLGKEVKLMCNLSEYFLELGIEQGIEQGLKQGTEQGIKQGLKQGTEQGIKQGRSAIKQQISTIRRLLSGNPEWDNNRLSSETGYPLEEIQEIREMLGI